MNLVQTNLGLEVQATDREATHFMNLLLKALQEKHKGIVSFNSRGAGQITEDSISRGWPGGSIIGEDNSFLGSVWYSSNYNKYNIILMGTPDENAYVKNRVQELLGETAARH